MCALGIAIINRHKTPSVSSVSIPKEKKKSFVTSQFESNEKVFHLRSQQSLLKLLRGTQDLRLVARALLASLSRLLGLDGLPDGSLGVRVETEQDGTVAKRVCRSGT